MRGLQPPDKDVEPTGGGYKRWKNDNETEFAFVRQRSGQIKAFAFAQSERIVEIKFRRRVVNKSYVRYEIMNSVR